jgi:branched-chain amino acid transport system ATP-binding protein
LSLLDVRDLVVRHGLLRAVASVTLTVERGEIVSLVGANGAGKSTLLRAVAGALAPAEGRIRFDGADITAVPAHRRVRLGICLVPEGRRLFPSLTVADNLLVAAGRGRPGPWDVDAVLEAFPVLRPLRDRPAGLLSGGEQQATAIGRALVGNPELLLLDEVSLGLSPAAVDAVYASLATVISAGTTVVLVEQDLDRGLRVASRVVCMLEGRVNLEGPAAELGREQITEAYFGLRAGDRPAGREAAS